MTQQTQDNEDLAECGICRVTHDRTELDQGLCDACAQIPATCRKCGESTIVRNLDDEGLCPECESPELSIAAGLGAPSYLASPTVLR